MCIQLFGPDSQGTYTSVYFSGINSKKEIWKIRNRQLKGLHFDFTKAFDCSHDNVKSDITYVINMEDVKIREQSQQ